MIIIGLCYCYCYCCCYCYCYSMFSMSLSWLSLISVDDMACFRGRTSMASYLATTQPLTDPHGPMDWGPKWVVGPRGCRCGCLQHQRMTNGLIMSDMSPHFVGRENGRDRRLVGWIHVRIDMHRCSMVYFNVLNIYFCWNHCTFGNPRIYQMFGFTKSWSATWSPGY